MSGSYYVNFRDVSRPSGRGSTFSFYDRPFVPNILILITLINYCEAHSHISDVFPSDIGSVKHFLSFGEGEIFLTVVSAFMC